MNTLKGALAQRWAELISAMGGLKAGKEPIAPLPKNQAEKDFNASMKETAKLMTLKMEAENLVQDISAFAALNSDDLANARALLRRVEALEGKVTDINLDNLRVLIEKAHKNK